MMVAPWLLAGDVNVILVKEARSDYNEGMVLSYNELAFSYCFGYPEVEDCSYVGPLYTWSNMREEGMWLINLIAL